MIRGIVNDSLEVMIPLVVYTGNGAPTPIEAILDTGFDGMLSMPKELIERIGLAWLQSGSGQLADGSEVLFDIHYAEIDWLGIRTSAGVNAVGASPIGMQLLENCEVNFLVRVGAEATIRRVA